MALRQASSTLALAAIVGLGVFTLGARAEPAETPATPSANATPDSASNEPAAAKPDVTQASTPIPAADPVVLAIRQRLTQVAAADKDEAAALSAFYADRKAPLWTDAKGFNERGARVAAELAKAEEFGLETKTYPLPNLSPGATNEALADAEIRLGLSALKYARHAKSGRVNPTKLSRYIDVDPPDTDLRAVLAAMSVSSEPDAVLRDQHPKHEQFQLLKKALAKARAPQSEPAPAAAQPVRIPDGPNLKPGATDPQIALLRQRLKVPAEAGQDDHYDTKLLEAVKSLQKQNKIEANGIINKRTRAALNADLPEPRPTRAKEIERIVLNMERWRWMPADLGAFHVWNNIPEFTTRVVKSGQVVHQEKIIVGKTDTQTPTFSADMKYVIFHPEWGVPDSIKVKEILPYLRRPAYDGGFFGFGGGGADTRVLQRHNLRVSMNGRPIDASKIDWNTVDIRQFQFIQPSGGQNVLGVVKFRFPNKHDVYMHDTPQRELFSAKTRTFSHGCMRVHNPRRLAEVLLAHDQGISSQTVGDYIARGGGANEITLKTRIPVHVTYLTATVDPEGNLQTYNDIYGHDGRLVLALSGKQTEFVDPVEVAERSATISRQANYNKKQPAPKGPPDLFSALFGN